MTAASIALTLASSAVVGLPIAASAQPSAIPTPQTHLVPVTKIAPLPNRAKPVSSTSVKPTLAQVPSASSSTIALSPDWKQLGSTGISLAEVQSASPASSLTASLLSPASVKSAGLTGVVVELTRTDSATTAVSVQVRIPVSVLDAAYGADYADRLSWTERPVSASVSDVGTPVSAAVTADSITLDPTLGAKPMILAAASGPVSSTGEGNFASTPLRASSTWNVSAQTGDFSWSYPMTVPPAAAGPSPDLALQYDSQSVDGETGSTNNQPTSVGEGWDLSAGGYIERKYVACSQDDGSGGPIASSGDLCWKTDNATISVAGHSGTLVKDAATGVWKLQSDDGSRIEHLVGAAQGCGVSNGTYDDDCWRMTTRDGTQYYFGLNALPGYSSGKPTTGSAWTVPVFGDDSGEPCHAASFAASSCLQAWRWNLDYVVDTHANAEALYYNQETNQYSRDGSTPVSYVRGGQLDHIDYGLTASNVYGSTAASDRVEFAYDSDGRCSDASKLDCSSEPDSGAAVMPASASYYPDIPFDQLCTSGSCSGQVSPTFWTTAMLTTITTQDLVAGSYATVDSWSLQHSFPATGDNTSAALWLTQVTHTGHVGGDSIAEPPTIFSGTASPNRVVVIDGFAWLEKYRVNSIESSLGAVTTVNYVQTPCTAADAANIVANPQANTKECFPEWWVPTMTYPTSPQMDVFNKYLVRSVVSDPMTGGGNDAAQETDYDYTGTAGWRLDTSPFTPAAQRTWSVFAGFGTVQVRVGASASPALQHTTDYTFFRGMDTTGTTAVTGYPSVIDSLWFAGEVLDTKVLDGVGGAVLSDTVDTPWASAVTANDGLNSARMTGVANSTVTSPLSTGGTRTTGTATTFNSLGLPVTVQTTASDAPSTCTTTTYAAQNTSAWLVGFPSEVSSVGVDCADVASAKYPTDALSDTKTSYDGTAVGAAPTRGDVTQTQVVDSYTGKTAKTAVWVVSSKASYDSLGRTVSSTDVLGHTTKTAYSPAASGPLTSETVTTTAPFNWTTTTTYNPAWGVETAVTDPNGNTTTAQYDALGRRTAVWTPMHPYAVGNNYQTPSTSYNYIESASAPSTIETVSSDEDTFSFFDGLGQPIETQSESHGVSASGSLVTETYYDAAGQVVAVNNPYGTDVPPSSTIFRPTSEDEVASQTATQYDGAGRVVKSTLNDGGLARYSTSTSYLGVDRVDVTPPSGGTPTTTYTNSRGQTTSLVQYLASSPSATAPTETTSYGYDVQGQMTAMTDPAGNKWKWSFDVLGHQVSATDPDTGTTTSTWDDAGNQLTSTDARGQELSYTYDALDRKTAEYAGANSASGGLLDSWSYDSVAKGQPASSTSYVGSVAGKPGAAYVGAVTGYDADYQATGTKITLPSSAPGFGRGVYTTSASYNADGTLASTKEPAEGGLPAETLRYGYDQTGQLNTEFGLSQILSQVVLTPTGKVAEYERGPDSGGGVSNYGYDEGTDAVTDIQDYYEAPGPDDSDGDPTVVDEEISDSALTYNAAGEVTSNQTTGDGVATDTQSYTYDYLQNLTQAWTPSSNSCAGTPSASSLGGPAPYLSTYSVDPATGNRTQTSQATPTSSITTSYSYPKAGAAQPHAVQSVSSGSAYTYDADGDAITRGKQSLTYDAEGKLSSVTQGKKSQSDVYDASGTLLLQSDSTSGSTLFLGDTELHVAPGSTTVSAVRTYTADGVPIAERDSSTTSVDGTLLWLFPDDQGTVTSEVNTGTGVVTRRYTDPFGNLRGPSPTWSSSHGFLNASTSATTGLTQLGARAYDPVLGRFLSVDPVLAPDNPEQNNGYSYAHNSPIDLSDPSGMDPPQYWDPKTAPTTPYVPPGWSPPAPGNSDGASDTTKPTCHGGRFSRCESRMLVSSSLATLKDASSSLHSSCATLDGSVASFACDSAVDGLVSLPLDPLLPALPELGGGAAAAGVFGKSALSAFGTESGEAVFWSGLGKGGEGVAANFAASNGGKTLEQVMAERQVSLPKFDASNPEAVAAWRNASESFARGAKGDVRVILGDDVSPGGIWNQVELPALLRNRAVTSISGINPETGAVTRLFER